MKSSVTWLSEYFYPERISFVEYTLNKVRDRAQENSTILDIGAGAGLLNRYNFRGRVQKIIGIDLDERVRTNPLLDEGIIADSGRIPMPDRSIDVAFSLYVLEHIQDPISFCNELYRVLRPGGHFFALTPNKYHYVPLIAGITPHSFHKWINKARGRAEEDTFPTYYKLNSRSALANCFEKFKSIEFTMLEGCPEYLKFNALTFLAGVCYERVVNCSSIFSSFRVNILIHAQKSSEV